MQLFFSFLCLFLFGCTPKEETLSLRCQNPPTGTFQQLGWIQPEDRQPYKIHLAIEGEKEEEQYLLITVELVEEDAYFVSPYADKSFKGLFRASLNGNEHLRLLSGFTETPRSVVDMDHGRVNLVRETTVYRYPLLHLSDKDYFEVHGVIQFVIEPRCTMELISFAIRSDAGGKTARVTRINGR